MSPEQITVNLDPKTATALSRWLSRTAITIGPPYLEASEAIAAMIQVTIRFTDVTDAVASQIRHERRERGRG